MACFTGSLPKVSRHRQISEKISPRVAKDPNFPTTSWTLIRKIREGGEKDAAAAMEEICRGYWYPIYAFARRAGHSIEDAEDLTQEVFASLVTHDSIRAAREDKGRMRTFMLGAAKNIIHKKLRHDRAERRGAGQAPLSLDELDAESRYAREPADIRDPDSIFDRAWAEGVLAAAEEKLRADFAKADNLDGYAQLRKFLPLGDHATPYASAAKKLGLSEATLRLQIHRVRKRYGKLIEEEIAQTVSDPAAQKAELAHLMAVMGR